MKLKYICLIPVIGFIVYLGGCFSVDKFAKKLDEQDALYNQKWIGAFLLIHIFVDMFLMIGALRLLGWV